MEKDNNVFLEHILESIEFIENYTAGLSEENFFNSMEKQDAIIRRLEIIGEAARNLTDNFKAGQAHIPWRDIADFRNVLIHEYFGVDKEKVWAVVKKDLPGLKQEIEFLLKKK
ncbi:MAG: DUF86 domain-containing protein [Parcubacteria group bacterium]|nr:DUF86 domain-containing protein [Parcubacteria group bacterium]